MKQRSIEATKVTCDFNIRQLAQIQLCNSVNTVIQYFADIVLLFKMSLTKANFLEHIKLFVCIKCIKFQNIDQKLNARKYIYPVVDRNRPIIDASKCSIMIVLLFFRQCRKNHFSSVKTSRKKH